MPAAEDTIASVTLPSPKQDPAGLLRHLYDVAVARALPLHNTAAWLPVPPDPAKGRTLVLGAGKAAGAMAHAVEALWAGHCQRHGVPGAPLGGLVVTRYGHTPPRPDGVPQLIDVLEAAHPVPDAAGLAAAQRILALASGHEGPPLTEHDLVLCLISGGGSSLLTLPADGLTLADKQHINRQLLDSGADITQMNCVRKHLSAIKGGRLAVACHPARVVTLTISDVPGDDVSVIASGPTVADATSCAEALQILQQYKIDIPATVAKKLQNGTLETPKPGDTRLTRSDTHLIATPQQSLEAAAAVARAAGLNAYILSDEIEGESREVGKVHAALARSTAQRKTAFQPPCVILSGGETTVTIKPREPGSPKGRGGRAGEFCMGLAQALNGHPGIWALAADTDGIDGVEANAGAQVAPDTLQRATQAGLTLADHLARNDAVGFFAPLGDLVITGPTHTNVNDFRV
ncbi:MAG: glycerate kinase, partial [Burkholderiales bacterium]|nr:glycerate kinase [Burkholderiales bacterium]